MRRHISHQVDPSTTKEGTGRDYWFDAGLWLGGLGISSLLALLVTGLTALNGQAWEMWWYAVLLVIFSLLAVSGLGILLCVFLGLPLPPIGEGPPWRRRHAFPIPVPLPGRPAAPPELEQETSTPKPEERIVVDVTPEELTGLFEGHSSIQARRLLEPYLGKWVTLSGPLADVGSFAGGLSQVRFTDETFGGIFVHMYFRDEKWADRLSMLRLGTHVEIMGQIDDVGRTFVQLQHCELVEP